MERDVYLFHVWRKRRYMCTPSFFGKRLIKSFEVYSLRNDLYTVVHPKSLASCPLPVFVIVSGVLQLSRLCFTSQFEACASSTSFFCPRIPFSVISYMHIHTYVPTFVFSNSVGKTRERPISLLHSTKEL